MSKWRAAQIEGRRVLVVEDDYLIASDLQRQFEGLGARVLGPVPRVRDAMRLIESGQALDGATVDVTLGGQKSFPIADALLAYGIPFVFVTGDDGWLLPQAYRAVPRYGKPADVRTVAEALFA